MGSRIGRGKNSGYGVGVGGRGVRMGVGARVGDGSGVKVWVGVAVGWAEARGEAVRVRWGDWLGGEVSARGRISRTMIRRVNIPMASRRIRRRQGERFIGNQVCLKYSILLWAATGSRPPMAKPTQVGSHLRGLDLSVAANQGGVSRV